MIGRAAGLPLGLITSVVLARGLGPEGFAHYSIAASIALLAQSAVGILFNRAAIKTVADAVAWEPVAVSLSRVQSLLGLGIGTILFLSADVLAWSMNNPDLAPLLRLFALTLPLGGLVGTYRNVVIGRQLFVRSAFFPVVFDVSRLLLVVVFLGMDWGVTGAVLSFIGASLVQFLYATRTLSLPLLIVAPLLPHGFFRFSLPLALDAMVRGWHILCKTTIDTDSRRGGRRWEREA